MKLTTTANVSVDGGWEEARAPSLSPWQVRYELAADWVERDAEDHLVELISLLDEVDDLQLLDTPAGPPGWLRPRIYEPRSS